MEQIIYKKGPIDSNMNSCRFYIKGTNQLHQNDNDTPAVIERDRFTNKIESIGFYKYGLLHRDEDKPSFICQFIDSNIIQWAWHQKEILHRENDQPARVMLNSKGIYEYSWYKNGRLHRDGDKPAYIFKNEHHIEFTWFKHGARHRDNDKPASIYEGSDISEHRWYKNDELHRDNILAAVIRRDKHRLGLSYYKHNKLHRLNGPAIFEIGVMTHQVYELQFYICGKLNYMMNPVYLPVTIDHDWIGDGFRTFNPFIGNVILKFISRMKLKYRLKKEKEILSSTTILSSDVIQSMLDCIA